MKDEPILTNIKVIKIDSETNEVIKDDFIFGIYEDAECTKLITEVKSNSKDGTALFENLRYNTYYIKEISSPKGYYLSSEIMKLEINDKGVFINDELLDTEDEIYSFKFANEKIPEINTGITLDNTVLYSLITMSLSGITFGLVILKRKNKKNN